MKTSYCITIITALLFSFVACTSRQNDQLTEQQKLQIKIEVKAVADSIFSRVEKLDVRWLDYYMDTPDWGMVNADGTRWDYQTTKKVQPDFFSSIISWKWTTTHEDFKFLTKDIVIYAIDGKDETLLKAGDKIVTDKNLLSLYGKDLNVMISGDRITTAPHAYTLIFKRIDGQWRIIYSHDSGFPVIQKSEMK